MLSSPSSSNLSNGGGGADAASPGGSGGGGFGGANGGVAAANSLRGRQLSALRQMLRLNAASSSSASSSASSPGDLSAASHTTQWKILVFDRLGQDLLAPILNVKALRDEGVTLHLLINSERDPVPDVPAIYFCQPNDDNLRRIAQDLKSSLYGSYYFNFISPISRQKLEDLATAALQANAVTQVQKLYDQYVNFICLEGEMFVLRHQSSSSLSYHALNRASVTDTEMEDMLGQIVDSLFAVCVTLGTIPIIRCIKGNAAEAVATRLDKKLRENLRDARNSLFVNDGIQAGQYSFYRPLLVLLDRQFDLGTPLHHTWTYQALAHDVLQYSLNRVAIVEPGDGAGKKQKTRNCDLDSHDHFWMNHKGSPFPLVAEKIQEELEDYRAREDDIKRMKHEMGVDGEDFAFGMLSDNTQRLTSAVSSLPVLLEKKRLIDMHTSLATAILEQIKLRKLDVFFELEEKVMSSRQQLPQAVLTSMAELLEDPEAGTPEDRMRLFIIYFLCSQQLSQEEVDKFSTSLEAAGCDLACLKYLQRWKTLAKLTQQSSSSTASSAAAALDYGGGGTKTISMFSKIVSQGSSFVMEGVKNLVVKKHNLPVTKIVEELMEIRPGQHQDKFLYFDPKIIRASGGTSDIPRAKNPFQEAIVFMVGGGNYIEYQNLMDYCGSLNKANLGVATSAASSAATQKRIIYGCTTLVNANQMMQQLAELGHEM